MNFLFYLFIFLFMILCGIICLVVLVQESKSLGLGASFGGDPGESLFGTSTAAVLKKMTAVLIAIFMASCVLLSIWSSYMGESESKPIAPSIEEVSNAGDLGS
jgi:preprotein translocase subunit SecG